MAWVSLVASILKILDSLTGYFRDKKLIDAGAATQAKESLDAALKVIERAHEARSASDRRNSAPGRLRDDDGFRRD